MLNGNWLRTGYIQPFAFETKKYEICYLFCINQHNKSLKHRTLNTELHSKHVQPNKMIEKLFNKSHKWLICNETATPPPIYMHHIEHP